MDFMLTEAEVRVLGCLMEKQLTTPDYYPLSLNALTNACNQKSNRDPVVAYTDANVIEASAALIQKGLIWKTDVGRVSKYEERFIKNRNLIRREISVLCVLLLRGPQTAGEIRGRTERMFDFNNIEAVNMTLSELEDMELVCKLPKQPGRKEIRYAHLLSGIPQFESGVETSSALALSASGLSETDARISELEADVASLRTELTALTEAFHKFRSQFE